MITAGKNTTKNLIVIALLIICAAAIFYAGYLKGGKREIVKVELKEKTDTIFVKKLIEVTKYKPVYDTIRIIDTVTLKDSVLVVNAEVAKLDTLIIDEPDSIHLRVWYYNKPLDYFNFNLGYKKPVITNTVEKKIYLQKPKSWLSNIGFGIGAGIDHRGKAGINLGIFYNLLPGR